MRRSLALAIFLGTTALTAPSPAHAGPLVGLVSLLATPSLGALSIGGFSLAAGTIGGALLNAAGNLLLSYGLSAIARRLQGRGARTVSPSDRMVNFGQPLTYMDWVFGQVRKGGPYAITSFQTDRRHYGVILAAHQIAGVDQWYIDDQPVEVTSNLVTTAPFTNYIGLRPYLGAPGQTADATLVSAIPEWTSAHNMAGLSYVAAFARRVPDAAFADVYGNSAPTGPVITPVIRGALVYDPRVPTTAYSNNAALVVAWVTENRLGTGVVNWSEVEDEADVSDDFVTNRSGGTQRKWTLNGSFSDDQDYASIIEQIILATDGYVYEKPDGTVGFKVGGYTEPTITLTEEDFYSVQWSVGEQGQDPVTEYVAQYVEPSQDYREAASATYVVDTVTRVNRQTVPLLSVNTHNQAMRCLKRIAKASRAEYALTGTIGLIALELLDQRFVNVELAGRTFVAEIGSISATEDDTLFEIELNSVEPEDFDFDASTEEPAPPPREDVTNDNTVPAPTGFGGAAVDGPGVEWSWTAQDAALNQQIRVRVVGASEWQPAVEITDDATDIIFPGLIDGESYEAELRNITAARRPSTWVASGTVVAVANSTPPGPVTGLSAVAAGSDITVSWTTPNDPLHASTRLYRAVGSGSVFGDATLLTTVYGPASTPQTYIDSGLSPETYVYWAKSANSSGVESTVAGPVDDTI